MEGIVLEIYRLNDTMEVRSDFYIITDPFDGASEPVKKSTAKRFITENGLVVTCQDNTGRIWDTPAQSFRQKHSATCKFAKPAKKETKAERYQRGRDKTAYRNRLFAFLDKAWDGVEEEETEED